jgi:hypothetical protein
MSIGDPDAAIYHRDYIDAHHKEDPHAENVALEGIFKVGRDNSRTPMQWDNSVNAGFTNDNPPWMKVNENKEYINVAAQKNDANSIWRFWRRQIALRKERKDVFMRGTFACHDIENERTFAYTKMASNGDSVFVMLNFSDDWQQFNMTHKHVLGMKHQLVVSNRATTADELARKDMAWLEPWEGRLYLLNDMEVPEVLQPEDLERSLCSGCERFRTGKAQKCERKTHDCVGSD